MSEIKPDTAHDTREERPGLKLIIDLAPLLLFFAAYAKLDIYWATGVLMAATVAALVAARFLLGRISPVLVMTAVLVCVFGALTFGFQDPRFIKMKPTIINLMFAGVLGTGLVLGRNFLRLLFADAFHLTDVGWRKLTWRWVWFFVSLGALNELVWRNLSEATWVNFKVFGILPLTIAFAIAQIGLIRRHELKRN